jgi:hypothetical protein
MARWLAVISGLFAALILPGESVRAASVLEELTVSYSSAVPFVLEYVSFSAGPSSGGLYVGVDKSFSSGSGSVYVGTVTVDSSQTYYFAAPIDIKGGVTSGSALTFSAVPVGGTVAAIPTLLPTSTPGITVTYNSAVPTTVQYLSYNSGSSGNLLGNSGINNASFSSGSGTIYSGPAGTFNNSQTYDFAAPVAVSGGFTPGTTLTLQSGVSAVPLPDTLPLFALALLCLGVFAWRTRTS